MIFLDQETFTSLLHDSAHWKFELFVGLIETIVIDVFIGFFLWKKWLKPRWEKRIVKQEHERHGIKDEH